MNELAIKWARRQGTGSLAAKATLMILASYANEDGRCFPALRTIAEDGCTDTKSIRRQLAQLEKLGLISWDRGGSHRANTYALALHVNPVLEGDTGAECPQSDGTDDYFMGAQRPQSDPSSGAERPQSGVGHSESSGAERPQIQGRSAHEFGGGAPTEVLTNKTSVGTSRARGSQAVAEALNATARSANVIRLVRHWAEGHAEALPRTTYDLLARQVETLRQAGAAPAHVWAALQQWDEKHRNGEKPKPGLLPYLHDQVKLDGLTVAQLYATPIDYLRDEDIDVFEVLGFDSYQPEAPTEVENGPMDERRAWYAEARAKRLRERCQEAKARIARKQQLRLVAKQSA